MSTTVGSWFRLAPHRPSWRIWDGAVIVFEPLSGDTHRIDAPAGYILAFLSESAGSKTAIESALASETSSQEIGEALDLMLAMELVEPV